MGALLDALAHGPRQEQRRRFALVAVGVLGLMMVAGGLWRPRTSEVPTSTSGVTSREVLYNGDTEQGTDGWGCDDCVQGSVSSPNHGGLKSLHVSQRRGPWGGPQQDMRARLINGATYQTEAWVLLATGATEAMATLELVTDTGTDYVTLTIQTPVDATRWAQLSGTATVAWKGTLQSARWYVETVAGAQDFYLDDASFHPLSR